MNMIGQFGYAASDFCGWDDTVILAHVWSISRGRGDFAGRENPSSWSFIAEAEISQWDSVGITVRSDGAQGYPAGLTVQKLVSLLWG